MSWRRDWPEREPRPKARKLSNQERDIILSSINNSIKDSPVLTALRYRVKFLRGRFYYEQELSGTDCIEIVGRVTPLENPTDEFLLEVEYGKNNWKNIKQGKIRTITNTISGDEKGTFHGLGILDKSIRTARKNKLDKVRILKKDKFDFYSADSDQKCSVQEVLFHFFDMPIPVIAEPREWYAYHRKPLIREVDKDNEAVLVDFTAMSISGDRFGGTCLYIKKDGEWGAFTIRPNQSDTIESSIQWLEKRQWKGW